MNINKIIYSLKIKDIQDVAKETLGRNLLETEIENIESKIAEYINSSDAIQNAIIDFFPEEHNSYIDNDI